MIYADPANLLPNEIAVFCLKCLNAVLFDETEQKYTLEFNYECQVCHYKFCPQCTRVHGGQTCEEHDRSLRNNIDEERSRKYMAKARQKGYYRLCYKCQLPQHRTYGCNHLTCKSVACKPKTDFCHICEQACPGSKHLDGDWYGLTCQTLTDDEKAQIRAKGKKFVAILNLLEDGTR